MPKVVPVIAPKDEAGIKAGLVNLLKAANALKIDIEPQGFAMAWLSDSTRIILATEGDQPVGMGIMAYGRRYYDSDVSASMLVAAGPARKDVLRFAFDMAKILGAHKFYYEAEPGDDLGGTQADMRMLEVT
jgi:hypothetical protein